MKALFITNIKAVKICFDTVPLLKKIPNLFTDRGRNPLIDCQDEARFVKNNRGAASLIDIEGFVYHKHKNSKNLSQVFWSCRDRKKYQCKARATTQGFEIIKKSAHNHSPPIEEYE